MLQIVPKPKRPSKGAVQWRMTRDIHISPPVVPMRLQCVSTGIQYDAVGHFPAHTFFDASSMQMLTWHSGVIAVGTSRSGARERINLTAPFVRWIDAPFTKGCRVDVECLPKFASGRPIMRPATFFGWVMHREFHIARVFMLDVPGWRFPYAIKLQPVMEA